MASNNFINECKEYANSNRLGKITIGNNEINQDNYLSEFEVNDGCFVNGSIIGSVYVKAFNGNFLELPDTIEIENKQLNVQAGVKFDDDTTEYVNLGNYDITTIKNSQTDIPTSIEAFDRLMNKLDKKYVCNIDFSTSKTIKDVYIDVCNNLGLTPVTTTFLNSDIEVVGNPFTENDTNRAVLQAICKVSCSYVELDESTGKIDLKWLSTSAEPDYIFNDGDDFSTLEGGITTFGPVNVVTIANSEVPSENVSMGTGDNEVVINEDYFLYNATLRQKAITNIYNRLKGLTYVDLKLTTYTGKPFIKIGSKIRVIYEGKTYDTYALIHTFKYDGTFTSIIESPALTKQETQIKNDVSLKEVIKNTQLIVNKQEGKINGLVTKTEDLEKEVTTIKETSGNNSLYVEDALESRVLEYGIDGKSEQETRSGKNLLYLDNVSGETNGITYTWNGNELTLNGTATSATDIYNFGWWGATTQNEKRLLKAGTYTLSTQGDNHIGKFSIQMYYGTSGTIGNHWTNMSTTKTLTEDKYYSNCYISIINGATFNNEKFYFQLESGSTATEYEQYGAMPSPDFPSEIKSVDGIRNLFDSLKGTSTTKNGMTITCTENSIILNGTTTAIANFWFDNLNIPLKKGAISFLTNVNLSGKGAYVWKENSTNILQTNNSANITIESDKTITQFLIQINSGVTFNNQEFKILLAEGNASTYVPYGSWLKVQTTSKNIFDKDNVVVGYRLGSDGTYYGASGYNATKMISVKPNKTYSTSWTISIMEAICTYDINGNFIRRITSGNSFTASNNEYLIRADVTDEHLPTAQIEKGTKTDYEPYKENISLIDMNKPNLFINKVFKDNYLVLSTGEESYNSAGCIWEYIKVEPNTTYTLTYNSNDYTFGQRICEYTSDKTFIKRTIVSQSSFIFTTSATTQYINLSGLKTDSNIKVYEGFDDYYELCSTNNKKDNLIVNSNGTATIEKKIGEIVLDGTESTLLENSATKGLFQITLSNIPNDLTTARAMSSHFKGINGSAIAPSDNSVCTYAGNRIMFTHKTYANNISGLKTWLSENKPIIQYELAEPYTIDLGQVDISLFENINHINLVDDIETETRVKYLINNVMNGTYATKGELELTNEQFQTTITNEFNSLERQMTSITQTGGAIDLAIQSSKDYTDSKNESLDNRITNSENNYNDLNNKYNTLNGKITDMNFSFKTDGLTIGTSGSEINSKLDNKGLKIYNASTLIAIFNQNGSGFKKLIVEESIQIQNLLIQKRTMNTPKANNMRVISFFFNTQETTIEKIEELDK